VTGPEHYREAERLLAGVTPGSTHPDGSPVIRSDEPETIAAAQVHATLALAVAIGDMLTDFSQHLAEHHQDGPS